MRPLGKRITLWGMLARIEINDTTNFLFAVFAPTNGLRSNRCRERTRQKCRVLRQFMTSLNSRGANVNSLLHGERRRAGDNLQGGRTDGEGSASQDIGLNDFPTRNRQRALRGKER